MFRFRLGRSKHSKGELTDQHLASRVDGKPRDPPKAATPVQLPLYPQRTPANVPFTAGEIYRFLCTFGTTGPTQEHVDALGIQVVADIPLIQLIPKDYLPPLSWLADPATSGGSNVFPAPLPPPDEKLRNGARKPGHEEFFTRAKEVIMDNEDAFRILQRKPPLQGRPNMRISHFRKMFENLSDIAEYWDTSLDNYITTTPEPEAVAMDIDKIRREAKAADDGKSTETSPKTPRVSYTGRRIGNGEEMAPSYRVNTINTFVETIAWCFRCGVGSTDNNKLGIHQMVIKVPPSDSVYCNPEDQQQARRGVREGPLMGIQCRSSTLFRKTNEIAGEGKSELKDLLLEVALGLLLAQKRDREGKQETRYWDGKWWCTKPRWGGGPGGLVVKDANETEKGKEMKAGAKAEAKDEVNDEANEKGGKAVKADGKASHSNDNSKPSDPARKKQKLPGTRGNGKPPSQPKSTWDMNVTYQHVGKVKGSNHDDIFLISSLVHHISIVHLRVPTAYAAYIGQMTPPPADFVPSQHPWYLLEVRRSCWYDLLRKEDRIEAMRAVWGVIGWLMRGEEKGEKETKEDLTQGGKYRF